VFKVSVLLGNTKYLRPGTRAHRDSYVYKHIVALDRKSSWLLTDAIGVLMCGASNIQGQLISVFDGV